MLHTICLNNIFKKSYFFHKLFQVNVNIFSGIYENHIFNHKLRINWNLEFCSVKKKIHYFQIFLLNVHLNCSLFVDVCK